MSGLKERFLETYDNHNGSEELEDFSGILASERDTILNNLIEQAEMNYTEKIILGSDILYAHAGVKDKNGSPLIPSGARLYQRIIGNKKYQDDTERKLFQHMSQEVKEKLQSVDCWVYKGVGDGTKLYTFFLELFNLRSDQTEQLKEKLNGKKLILQDVSGSFLKKTNKLFEGFGMEVLPHFGDFFSKDHNGTHQILGDNNCILMLGKTAGNFDANSMTALLGMNSPRHLTQRVFFYSTYETTGELTDKKYVDNEAVNKWILGGWGALLGKDHIHELEHFDVIIKSHEQNEDKTIPARVLVGVTPKKDIQISSADGEKIFSFKKGKEYFMIASARPTPENLDAILMPDIVYTNHERGIGAESKELNGFDMDWPVLEKKIKRIDTYNHWMSLFCELKYSPRHHSQRSHDGWIQELGRESRTLRSLKFNRGITISNLLNKVPFINIQNLGILLLLFLSYAYLEQTKEKNRLAQEQYQIFMNKRELLCNARETIQRTSTQIYQQALDSLCSNASYPFIIQEQLIRDIQTHHYIDNTQTEVLLHTYRTTLQNRNAPKHRNLAHQYLYEKAIAPQKTNFSGELKDNFLKYLIYQTNLDLSTSGKHIIQAKETD